MKTKTPAQLKRSQAELEQFTYLMKLAGFEVCIPTPLENGYWPDGYDDRDFYTYWYKFETELGVIAMGWRKHVIHIDWKATNLRLHPFFYKEDVTKTELLIHAWTFEKALQYLTEIRKALQLTPDGYIRARVYNEGLEMQLKQKEQEAKNG